jgi:hypothetical protein
MAVRMAPTHTRLGQARFYKGGKLTLWEDARFPRPSVTLGTTREPIVPLVGSEIPGTIGLLHLPRMWMEGLLAATGRLAPDFAEGRPIFDEILCHIIGVDRDALVAFVRTEPLPDYLECEAWVQDHAKRLDPWAIEQVNNAIRKAQVDGEPVILHDNLRAWRAVYDYVLGARPNRIEPIVPAVSSRACGAVGVDHLPRVWIKSILKAGGALPIGYRSGYYRVMTKGLAVVPNGLDLKTCRAIGLDEHASVRFLDENLPDYPAYERWVRGNARKLDVASVARHNALREDTRAPKAEMEKRYAGWGDSTHWSYIIDDLIDWRLIYDAVTGRPLPAWNKI